MQIIKKTGGNMSKLTNVNIISQVFGKIFLVAIGIMNHIVMALCDQMYQNEKEIMFLT